MPHERKELIFETPRNRTVAVSNTNARLSQSILDRSVVSLHPVTVGPVIYVEIILVLRNVLWAFRTLNCSTALPYCGLT
jgi:hypothetical protein